LTPAPVSDNVLLMSSENVGVNVIGHSSPKTYSRVVEDWVLRPRPEADTELVAFIRATYGNARATRSARGALMETLAQVRKQNKASNDMEITVAMEAIAGPKWFRGFND